MCLALGVASSAGAAAGTGGAFAGDPAIISAVGCVARCASVDTVQAGSLLRIRGTHMKDVTRIVFLGASGPADDVTVSSVRARLKSVDVLVPAKALSGPLLVMNHGGASLASRAAISIRRIAASGGPLDVKVVGTRVFLAAARQAQINILTRAPMAITVALVRLSDGALVMGWPLGTVEPGAVRSVTWNGTVGGVTQPAGRYEFRVFSQTSGAQAAQTAQPALPLATGAFELVDAKFPIRGKHTYGTGIAAFGSQRNGHSHQGQDVFAACGTPLVAARGGIVKLNKFESNAGNYLVIDGAGTDFDYTYMHLRERSPLKKGAVVLTGQAIGEVGQTGDATACHLHFEIWTGPGWYTGGQPIDPLASLKLWDAYS
jgi:murein DD-endopeptidase MepM/ murein hydrolase activator NlpD